MRSIVSVASRATSRAMSSSSKGAEPPSCESAVRACDRQQSSVSCGWHGRSPCAQAQVSDSRSRVGIQRLLTSSNPAPLKPRAMDEDEPPRPPKAATPLPARLACRRLPGLPPNAGLLAGCGRVPGAEAACVERHESPPLAKVSPRGSSPAQRLTARARGSKSGRQQQSQGMPRVCDRSSVAYRAAA